MAIRNSVEDQVAGMHHPNKGRVDFRAGVTDVSSSLGGMQQVDELEFPIAKIRR